MWAGIRNCVCVCVNVTGKSLFIRFCAGFSCQLLFHPELMAPVCCCVTAAGVAAVTTTTMSPAHPPKTHNRFPSKNYHLNAFLATNCCLILPTVFLSFSSGEPTTCFQTRFHCCLISGHLPSHTLYSAALHESEFQNSFMPSKVVYL